MPTGLTSPQRPSLMELRWKIFRARVLLIVARAETLILRMLLAAVGGRRKQ